MPLSIIDKNAEDLLYATVSAEQYKNNHANYSYVHCKFFQIGKKISSSDFANIYPSSNDIDSTAYICADGDIFLKLDTPKSNIVQDIINNLAEAYSNDIQSYMPLEDFFVIHGWNKSDTFDQIKFECFKKMKRQTKGGKELSKYFSDIRLISTLKKVNQLTKMQRAFRASPHILIVEDQIFSQKMLTSILKDYTCYVASSSAEALVQYIEKCPDIVFLDIELPDLSGHSFAKFINKIDPESYIIMATANHYPDDIKQAKENNVKGFIAKPFEKDTLLKTIEIYKKNKKKK